ncbi:MAG: PhoU domain-containing protein, partial [Acidimicrobiales bacterium]|nr:PhoU domain-containing protein [Acidimicrobiales bacterium]
MSFFRSDEGGISQIESQVQRMIADARHTFDLAMNAVTGGAVETVADEVRRTDRQINVTEIEIRRELLVHISVHGTADAGEMLVFMNMIKDLERIGDYNKNIFDLALEGVSFSGAEDLEQILGFRDELSSRIALMGEILDTRDEDRARAYIERGDQLRREFDGLVN